MKVTVFFSLQRDEKNLRLIIYQANRRLDMEIYLFAGLLLVYVITALVLKKDILRKLWLIAFMAAFAVSAAALSFLRFSHQEVMMNAAELSWYYILYLFASIMVVLGAINLWLFRHDLINVLFANDEDSDDIS